MSEQAIPPEQAPDPKSEENATRKTVLEPRARRKPVPRVKKNPGVKPADTMAEAGRKILRFQFAHMLNHEEGTRLGEDIEELHDMRVATRRMRAAMDVFGPHFKRKAVKKQLKRLRIAGRTLGRVRDLDVFMEKTLRYLGTLPQNEHAGLDPLVNGWEQKRTAEREKLISYLDGEDYSEFKKDFNEFTSSPEESAVSIPETNPTPNRVNHIVPVLIYSRLTAVRAHETLLPNAAVEQLHALRIELKKLRYALEFFQEVLGKESKAVINELKKLQDHLGSLNDANVACQILSGFIEKEEARQNKLPLHEQQNLEPIVAYLANQHAERHNLMSGFPKLWERFNRRETMRNIALSISGL